MHYLDINLCVSKQDLIHFRSCLFEAIHRDRHLFNGEVAIAFPQWVDSDFITNDLAAVKYAQLGALVRLFGSHDALISVIEILGLSRDQAAGIITFGEVTPAPQSASGVAYVRSRLQEKTIKLSRERDPDDYRKLRDSLDVRQAREAIAAQHASKTAYIQSNSKSSQRTYSVFLERLTSNTFSSEGSLNSYGLSNKISPWFLPDF